MGDTKLRIAGFYGRVSGPDEESTESQLAVARETAAAEGYRIPSGPEFVYTDVHVSGATLSRGEFDRLKRDVLARRAPFDRLYVRASDRFGRWSDPRQYDYHLVLFEEHGVTIRFCDEDRHLDFREGVQDADVGQYLSNKVDNLNDARERTKLIRKMRRAKRHRAIKGFYPGGATPYGYERVLVDMETREVVRVVSEGEKIRIDGCRFTLRPLTDRRRDAVRFIFDAVERGLALRAVAKELNRLGYPSPTPGRPWYGAKVSRIVRNPIYMGTLRWGARGERIPLENAPEPAVEGVDPIVIPNFISAPPISPEQFFRVQAVLDANSTLWKRRRSCQPKYLFSGMIACSVCGRLFGGMRQSRTGRLIYRHPNTEIGAAESPRCPEFGLSLRGESLDEFLLAHIRTVLSDPDLEQRVRERILESLNGTEHRETVRRIERLRERAGTLAQRMTALQEDLEVAESKAARQALLQRIDRIGLEIDGIQNEVHELEVREVQMAAQLDTRGELVVSQAALLEMLDSDTQRIRRALIERIVEYIHARPTTKEIVIALRYA